MNNQIRKSTVNKVKLRVYADPTRGPCAHHRGISPRACEGRVPLPRDTSPERHPGYHS